tara:strand:- start:632 stop:1072 length:441 start_codon:yes stop_codon:yes gene_type:complete
MKDKLLTFTYFLWIIIILSVFIISMLNYKNKHYDDDYLFYPRTRYIYPRTQYISRYPRNQYITIETEQPKKIERDYRSTTPSYAKGHSKGYYKVKEDHIPLAKGRYIDHAYRQESQKEIDKLEESEDKNLKQAILNSVWEQYINYY